jgi:hypothetical protein
VFFSRDIVTAASSQQQEELAGLCTLLESLLAADPSLAPRLGGLVAQLAGYMPSPQLSAWLSRMFILAVGSNKGFPKNVSHEFNNLVAVFSQWTCVKLACIRIEIQVVTSVAEPKLFGQLRLRRSKSFGSGAGSDFSFVGNLFEQL